MNSTNDDVFTSDPPVFLLKNLTVRALDPHEYERAGELLEDEHYLGDVPRGRRLLQAVEYKDQWVALLDWGSANWKLADREEWIGWTAQQRAQRLSLVVLNRRFLVLGRTRMPNLASKSLALATNALPEHWERAYGYKPLLAETFSDIEQYEGTCYKASNWIACSRTKGFKRHRGDYYREHRRPKKLWLKTLNRNTRRILTSMDLPPAYRKALNTDTPERDPPLKKPQLESLGEYLHKHLADPRHNRSTLRKIPSYTALRNLLMKIDPHKLGDCLNRWLQANLGTLPRALAVDGKWIRDRALSLCLSEHETGAPVAMGFAKEKTPTDKTRSDQDQSEKVQTKEDYKREGEHSVALRLYGTTELENATVTGDALNNNKPQAQAILEGGGDYFQLKDENRHAYQSALQKAEGTPLLPTPKNPTPPTGASTGAE